MLLPAYIFQFAVSLVCISKRLRQGTKMAAANMRGMTAFPVKNILKQIHPMKGTLGILTTTPKKQGENNVEGRPITDDKAEPIVALNKPLPPPVLGPFVVLSLLEMGSDHDGKDD